MEIEHCSFPDDILYDVENNTWAKVLESGEVVVGITSVLSGLAGRFISVRLKQLGLELQRGRSLGTLESTRFVGPIPTPLTGRILAINQRLGLKPKILNDSPYEGGWIARLCPSSFESEKVLLSRVNEAEREIRRKIEEFRVRCFKAYPDHEMFEIGVECAAVLVRLNELLAVWERGIVVHIVSDDPTAYVEMERWVDQTKNDLVDWRTEGNLFHFIVRKTTG